MTKNIILDTTVKFIRDNEQYLELAFLVEEALPIVRKERIKDFFKCVEKQLKKNLDTKKGWEIRATDHRHLRIHKPCWEQLRSGEVPNEGWGGISLYPYNKSLVISVKNIENISEDVKQQIMDNFRNSINQPKVSEKQEIWNHPQNNLGDVSCLDLLKKMIDEKEQRKIVEDMTEKLAELAEAVDGVLSNSR